jgi:hypothetical protein
MGRALAVALLLVACSERTKQAPELAAYLYARTGDPSVVDEWRLTRDEWARVVVAPYDKLYDDYVQRFAQHAPGLRTQLAHKHPIVTRAHVAGDPVATRDQAVTRWALPTLAPTRVAELAGKPARPIDAVFVEIDGRWRAIVGLSAIVYAHVWEHRGPCAHAIEQIAPAGGRCIELAWTIADAALREDLLRLEHVCSLAKDVCGKPRP